MVLSTKTEIFISYDPEIPLLDICPTVMNAFWTKWCVKECSLHHYLSVQFSRSAAAAKSLQSCPILCDPIDGNPPGSPVPGILQARTLEWVAISFSNAWKWKVRGKSLSPVPLSATPWTAAYQAPPSMGFSRQEYWSGVPLPSLFSRSVMSNSLWPHGLYHTRLPCPSPTPVACSNSCPSSQWCHPTLSSSVVPFSSCLQSIHNSSK